MAQNQLPSSKTRMRTSFDPEQELPKLQQWFNDNHHPSRQQIQRFVKELNSLDSRRGRKPLDINNVIYWFKNARAAQKRAETRNFAPTLHYKMLLNGYNSNSQSPSEGGAAKSPGSLNQDSVETMEPLLTPQGSPQPNSPQRTAEQDESVKEEGGENQKQAQNSIIDSTNNNNNNTNDKDEQNEMSLDEEEDDEDEYEKDFKVLKGDSGGGSGGQQGPRFPLVRNSLLGHSIMYMSHFFPPMNPAPVGLASLDERRKRNRTFIDPVSEVPRLEEWFSVNTHPSHNLILQYTEDLNQMPYRQKFPPLETKNVQFWFKNRRAKCKRLKMSMYNPSSNNYHPPNNYTHHIPTSLTGEAYQAH